MIKIDAENVTNGIADIEKAWREVNSDFAFEYFFVEDTFARLYAAEQEFGRLFISFAVLAVSIACLGLFGLASFTAERRAKEISVRRVLGATIPTLFVLMSGEFLRLVVVANLISWPVAFIAMNNWLSGFAYRVDLEWTTFVLSGAIAMAIALFTVSYQALTTATANPIERLQLE